MHTVNFAYPQLLETMTQFHAGLENLKTHSELDPEAAQHLREMLAAAVAAGELALQNLTPVMAIEESAA